MILERSANSHPQQSHLSQHNGVVLIKVALYFILSCYEPTSLRMSTSLKQLTQDLQAAYLYGCRQFVYERNELYQYV